MASNREVIERYAHALTSLDYDLLQSMEHPEFIELWPQSGERIRGPENMRAINDHFRGRPTEGGPLHVVGSEDRWVMTPTFSALRIEGSGDVYTVILKAIYPPESLWYVTTIIQLRDQLVWRATTYFAQAFEPPEWRAQWTERMSDAERDAGGPRGAA